MKETFHICHSSHDEVMFRSEEDLIIGFNYLAVTALENDSALLADGFLSTHHHEVVRTDDPIALGRRNRYSYTRYFNSKYHRKGSLGENHIFTLKIDGLYHTQALLNYVLKQGLHHGLATTAFGYRHCSANSVFRNDLGKTDAPVLLEERKRHLFLPSNTRVPSKYRMRSDGLLLREDIEDMAYVENVYVSPRNFLYQMNRISNGKDIAEQQQENSLPVITLESVERGVPGFDPAKAFVAEQGRINKNRLTDIELCQIIDGVILPSKYFKSGGESSIYLLPDRARADIGNQIWKEYKNVQYQRCDSPFSEKIISEDQLRRCLFLK